MSCDKFEIKSEARELPVDLHEFESDAASRLGSAGEF